MEEHTNQILEKALAITEESTKIAQKAASEVARAFRKLHTAAREGNLRELNTSFEVAESAIAALRQQFSNTKDSWEFDEESYFNSNAYIAELLAAGRETGCKIFERDGQIYCYPALIRISPGDRTVLIDKKREKCIRPSNLAKRLYKLQSKPSPFKPEPFLEMLFKVYQKAVAIAYNTKALQDEITGPQIPLIDIYELLTLFPGKSREYPKEEFAHDIYLLHYSGTDTIKSGASIKFPFTGKVKPNKMLSVIDEEGNSRRYYSVCFTQLPKKMN